MPDTPVARRGRTVRRASAALAVLVAAATATACGSSAHTRTVTDTGAAGATTTRTMTTATTASSSTTTPGAPAGPAAPGPLTASPATGGPTSNVTFTFRPRSLAYSGHQIAVTYGLSIHGPVRSGCVGEHAVGVPVTRLAPESVTVGPSQLGGRWCTGTYTARVEAVARPVCAPGTMCPQFVRIVASFGPATFKITGGA